MGTRIERLSRVGIKVFYVLCRFVGIFPFFYDCSLHKFRKSRMLSIYNYFCIILNFFCASPLTIVVYTSSLLKFSKVIARTYIIHNLLQLTALITLYNTIARKKDNFLIILNKGNSILQTFVSEEFTVKSFKWILIKQFIFDFIITVFNGFLITVIASERLGRFGSIPVISLLFPTAARIFGNLYFMSLYFNAFLLNIINVKFVKVMSSVYYSMNLKGNITKYQLDSVYNKASEKIDEISIQYSQMTNFTRDCSNLFPKTILILLIYVFGSGLMYSFMLFAMIRTFMVENKQCFINNQRFIYLIINGVVFDLLNLYWLVMASAKMEQQVCLCNQSCQLIISTLNIFSETKFARKS